eukprot:UN04837
MFMFGKILVSMAMAISFQNLHFSLQYLMVRIFSNELVGAQRFRSRSADHVRCQKSLSFKTRHWLCARVTSFLLTSR